MPKKNLSILLLFISLTLPFLSYGQAWEAFKTQLKKTQFQYDNDFIIFDSLINRYESELDTLEKIEVLFSIEEYTYKTYLNLEIAIDSMIIDFCDENINLLENPQDHLYFKRRKGKALSYLASTYAFYGRFPDATTLFNESFILYNQLEDKAFLANVHNNFALMLEDMGNFIEANKHYLHSLALRDEINEKSNFTVTTLTNLGLNYHELGNEQEAIIQYDRAYELSEKLNLKDQQASIINNIGLSYATIKEFVKARKYFKEALELSLSSDDKRTQANIYINLGNMYEDLDSNEKALDYYYKSFEVIQNLTDRGLKADISNNLGIIHMNLDNFDLSAKYYDQAFNNYSSINDSIGLAGVLSNQSELAYKKGNLNKAVELNKKAMILMKGSNYIPFLRSIYERQCGYLAELGMYEEALEMNAKYNEIYEKIHSYENQKSLIGYDLQLEYEKATLKKELDHQYEIERAQLKLDNEQSKTRFWFVLGLAFLSISILGYLTTRYRTNKRIASEKLAASEKLTEAIILSQEEERKRISQELHDGIGAELIAAKFKLSSDTSNEAYSMIEKAITDIRNLSHQLIPPAIEKQSIQQSIENYLVSIKQELPFEIETSFIGDLQQLSPATKISIYRILQECISNTIKYAKASNVTVQLTLDEGEFSMIYEDDGIGFDKSIHPTGIGIKNMESRVHEIGGNIEISSAPGHGTSILLTLSYSNT